MVDSQGVVRSDTPRLRLEEGDFCVVFAGVLELLKMLSGENWKCGNGLVTVSIP